MTGRPDRRARPRVFSIASGLGFSDSLVAGLRQRHGAALEALADLTLLLPNRRAVQAVSEAFLRASEGKAALLPRLRPLGEVEEEALDFETALEGAETLALPPAISPLERQLTLARLIARWHARAGHAPALIPAEAARMAASLAQLIDQVETEGLDWAALEDLAPARFASHWQETLAFLDIVTKAWPAHLAAGGRLDPAARRRRLMLAQAQSWQVRPPTHPVVAAGSTGSLPATAALLSVVARLPHGAVILPGLDETMEDEEWRALEPDHPQYGLKRLLETMGVDRHEVAPWTDDAPPPAIAQRLVAVRHALRQDGWDGKPAPAAELDLELLEAANERAEAAAIAVMLREALQTPRQRAALVTPDRSLARRVAAELGRWGLVIDDSAGQPLARTAVGRFLCLILDALTADLAPVPLVALLKHPLCAGGQDPADFRRRVRRLEIAGLRGVRPMAGPDGFLAAAREAELEAWAARLVAALEPLHMAMRMPRQYLATLLDRHLRLAETLAASDTASGAERLWADADGEAAADFCADLRAAASAMEAIPGAGYGALFASLMAPHVVRPLAGRHPRLALWGTLEARLQKADLMILAGLNEGTWPAQVTPDPWMSAPMREEFGLPPAARRIGLAAHDFVEALGAPRVVLTRALKVGGAPTVPSRWLSRLKALHGARLTSAERYAHWARALDEAPAAPPAMPAPRPPLHARPSRLSVTQVELWMRDPYALYARAILGLKPLDPLDADPGALERGVLIHTVLERFMKAGGGDVPALLAVGEEAFAAYAARPAVRGFWWPRFVRIAEWFIATQRARADAGWQVAASEREAALAIAGASRPFTLTAKADRIDRGPDGALEIIDYKTGGVPTQRRLAAGFAPQLPLEGLLAEEGAFQGLAPAPVGGLAYWRLAGGETPGQIIAVKAAAARVREARAGLLRLIAAFAKETTPYLPSPRPDHAGHGDYDHLARLGEWRGPAGGEEG
ncbi:MAG: double-strand break repair protein AddB [Pseudomonadota bacterium]